MKRLPILFLECQMHYYISIHMSIFLSIYYILDETIFKMKLNTLVTKCTDTFNFDIAHNITSIGV